MWPGSNLFGRKSKCLHSEPHNTHTTHNTNRQPAISRLYSAFRRIFPLALGPARTSQDQTGLHSVFYINMKFISECCISFCACQFRLGLHLSRQKRATSSGGGPATTSLLDGCPKSQSGGSTPRKKKKNKYRKNRVKQGKAPGLYCHFVGRPWFLRF